MKCPENSWDESQSSRTTSTNFTVVGSSLDRPNDLKDRSDVETDSAGC